MPIDFGGSTPFAHGIRGQFSSMVAHYHASLAAYGDQIVELAHHSFATDRGIRKGYQTLARHIIDHVECRESVATRQLVVHEVEAQVLVRRCR